MPEMASPSKRGCGANISSVRRRGAASDAERPRIVIELAEDEAIALLEAGRHFLDAICRLRIYPKDATVISAACGILAQKLDSIQWWGIKDGAYGS